mmetsp:Transcript_7046/g.13081  ORF Transcript_7046/g.13081 Transcript_7046/m.13081 type:complete len:228 (+) Transcript_7046:594-1277(+)
MPAKAPSRAPVPPEPMTPGPFISSIAAEISSCLMESTMSIGSPPLDRNSSLVRDCTKSFPSSSLPTCTKVMVSVESLSNCSARCFSNSTMPSLSSGWPALMTRMEHGFSSKPRSKASSSARLRAATISQDPWGSWDVTMSLILLVRVTSMYLSTASSLPGKQYTSTPSVSIFATCFEMLLTAVTAFSHRDTGSPELGGGPASVGKSCPKNPSMAKQDNASGGPTACR